MYGGGEMILGNRHDQPRHEMTFVIRLVAVHPMELRIRIWAPLLQPHAQLMGEAGDQLCPRDMVPNSDFGMVNGEP